jgi:phage shock protein PspC (stress-responsive transcriptional regulator)
MRNFGGFIGDLIFIRDKQKERKITGVFCGIASVAGIIQRQIKNPKIARIFSHLLLAADNIGFSFWSYLSHLRNKPEGEFKA